MRRTLYGVLSMAARSAQRERRGLERERAQAQRQAVRQAEQARVRFQRFQDKESKRLYLESQASLADEQTEEVDRQVRVLSLLLNDSLSHDPLVDFHSLREPLASVSFTPGKLAEPEPKPQESNYQPPPLDLFHRLIPSSRREHQQAVFSGNLRFESALIDHTRREAARMKALDEAKSTFDQSARAREIEVAKQHAAVEAFEADVRQGVPESPSHYFTVLLESRDYPDDFPQIAKAAFVSESSQLVVEYDFPTIAVVPETTAYKYVKAKDEITAQPRPQSQRRNLYASVLAQVVLRSLREIFNSPPGSRITSAVFNGHVDTIDRGTGKPIRPCLISVRTTREAFSQIDLRNVEPLACLKVLNAAVSKDPSELSAVRPVLEFKMVDPRFVAGTDVLSSLDQRPNLMDLSPTEFEALISNLFGKMGLETRQTRPSRDDGVDCVAYDPRPILGGKVVIQAKRYKNTVGVSAVRDLFGTLQNEGASKGILVTTSGYGRAAFEFAAGKPIELISGSNLLYLLAEHAGVEARIVVPDDWLDPVMDSPTDVD